VLTRRRSAAVNASAAPAPTNDACARAAAARVADELSPLIDAPIAAPLPVLCDDVVGSWARGMQ